MEDKLLKTVEQMNAAFKSVYDWHCFPMCNEDDAHLFLGEYFTTFVLPTI